MTTSNISLNTVKDYGNSIQSNKQYYKGAGFDSIINGCSNNKNGVCTNSSKQSRRNDIESNDGVDNNRKEVVNNDSVKDFKKVDNDDLSKVESVNQVSEDNNVASQETISGEIKKVIQLICETLEIDEDELEEIMTQLGISDISILDNNLLKDIVLQALGESDLSVFVTNEDLLNLYTSLCDELSKIEIPDNADSNGDMLTNDFGDSVLAKENAGELSKAVVNDAIEREDISGEANGNITIDGKADDAVVKPDIQIENGFRDKSNNSKQDSSHSSDDILNSIVEGLSNAASISTDSNVSFLDAVNPVTQMNNIVNQIVERIRIEISSDNTSMELMLNPEHLGRLHLSVTSREGVMTAQFIVENETARQAIESQIQVLKDNLENQGVKVEAVEVSVSNMTEFTRDESSNSNAFEQSSEAKKKSRNSNINLFEDEEIDEQDAVVVEMMKHEGSNVNFTA